MGITDEYAAFCFDEACSFILARLTEKDAEKPRWNDERKSDDLIGFLKNWK